MKKFSELGVTVQDERKMFNCSQGFYFGRAEL